MVQEQYSSFPEATGILRSCADACSTHSLSLSSILQEKSIENHTPLYWAIVKRLPDEHHQASGPDLISALLSYSAPLSSGTITDVRRGCLASCDQRLFQRLRLSPEFAFVSGVDQMLLGGTIPTDNIEVEDGDGGEFRVTFEVQHFHKRMMVSKEIGLEFLARSECCFLFWFLVKKKKKLTKLNVKDRMWRLEFSISPRCNSRYECQPGSWCISLYLLESSPPTWIDSRVIIRTKIPSSTDHHPDQVNSSVSALFMSPSKSKPIELRLQSSEMLENSNDGWHPYGPNRAIVMLQENLIGANPQYG